MFEAQLIYMHNLHNSLPWTLYRSPVSDQDRNIHNMFIEFIVTPVCYCLSLPIEFLEDILCGSMSISELFPHSLTPGEGEGRGLSGRKR